MAVPLPSQFVAVDLDDLDLVGPSKSAIATTISLVAWLAPYVVVKEGVSGIECLRLFDHDSHALQCDPHDVVVVRCGGVNGPGARVPWHQVGCRALLALWCMGLVPKGAKVAVVLPNKAQDRDPVRDVASGGGTVLWSPKASERPVVAKDVLVASCAYGDAVFQWRGDRAPILDAAATWHAMVSLCERSSRAAGMAKSTPGWTPRDAGLLAPVATGTCACDLALERDIEAMVPDPDAASTLSLLLAPTFDDESCPVPSLRSASERLSCLEALDDPGSKWLAPGSTDSIACELRGVARRHMAALGSMVGALDAGVALEDVLGRPMAS